jgi:hypothetical protein
VGSSVPFLAKSTTLAEFARTYLSKGHTKALQ